MKAKVAIGLGLVFGGCAASTPRQPAAANAELAGEAITLYCPDRRGDVDVFAIAPNGEVSYKLETDGFATGGRGRMRARFFSKNTGVITGRTEVDYVCASNQPCDYEYFTIHFDRTGSAIETKTIYTFPARTFRAETRTYTCRLKP